MSDLVGNAEDRFSHNEAYMSVSSNDRQSIKGHHAKNNSYTDLLSIQLLLCRVVNCSRVNHLYYIPSMNFLLFCSEINLVS